MKLLSMIAVKFGRLVRARSGNSMVEFALILPLFLLLTLGVLDFGRLFWTQETLSYALREAGRYAVTGQHMSSTNGALSRVQSIINVARQYSAGIDVSQITVSTLPCPTCAVVSNSAGGKDQTVVISLTTALKLLTPVGAFFPNNTYTFTTSTAFRNEPFNPAMDN
ncbi:MAG: TadE/TadG family type IV pilus assembly protein [Verrucomicrobiia bacterium]